MALNFQFPFHDQPIQLIVGIYMLVILLMAFTHYKSGWAFFLYLAIFILSGCILYFQFSTALFLGTLITVLIPLQLINILCFALPEFMGQKDGIHPRYKVKLPHRSGTLTLANIRRGVSIIGSAGSGKTESVVHGLLLHFEKHKFCGVIHDYKHFEITEMAYPLYAEKEMPFHIISLDEIHKKVNPIAPRYLPDEESVNEVSRVLLENLMEQRENSVFGSSKFFNDAVEGLLGGLIWKLKTEHPNYCTLPHLIAVYQYLSTGDLMEWLSSNVISRAMADAFISGRDSERQTAGVLSSLANALKKISTQRIFMALSADEVPLDINNKDNPAVVAIVNNPKYETAYSPVIATILHTITKQMSVRGRLPSFDLMEEASTLRQLNMHRIPATLRSYDIVTVYVLQDKVQNDMMYGDKASRAILGNLSYQFFGKVNDPDTARYYERFFELVKRPPKSVSKGQDPFRSDTRVTRGEREVSKIRSDEFFRLEQGEFICFSDGRDRKIRFPVPNLVRSLPEPSYPNTNGRFEANFKRIHLEARALFQNRT